MRIEPDFWNALLDISRREGLTVHELCSLVAARRYQGSLTEGLRVFALRYFAGPLERHDRGGRALRGAKVPYAANASQADDDPTPSA